jgi:hypothetical protein
MKKRLKLEIRDKEETKVTHHFDFETLPSDNLMLTLNGKVYLFDSEGNLTGQITATQKRPKGSPKYYNPKTKKTQKLFEDPLQNVWMVRYQNPYVGNKGEALYLVVEASSKEAAKHLAMVNEEFTKHIFMKYYDEKYLTVYKPMGNYVIGKVIYFEGDPRL